MANWITASITATRTGATSANSTAVCPLSEAMGLLGVRVIRFFGGCSRALRRDACDERRDAVEPPGNGDGQGAERQDDADGDHGENDAGLGHPLTFFTLECGAEEAGAG